MDYEVFKTRVNNFLYYAYLVSGRGRVLAGAEPLAGKCAFFRVKYGLPYRYTGGDTRVAVRRLGDAGFWGLYYHWRNWRLAWRIGADEALCAEKYKENFHWRTAARLYRHLGVTHWDVGLCLRMLFFPEYVGQAGARTLAGVLRILDIGSRVHAPADYLPVPLRGERVSLRAPLLRDI